MVVHPRTQEGERTGRWTYQLTIGLQFDTDGNLDAGTPIAFTKFQDVLATPVGLVFDEAARVPFSILSLMEANAVSQSIKSVITDRQAHKGQDAQDYYSEFMAEINSRLFDRTRALYSVTAHMAANALNLFGDAGSYGAASVVARISLLAPNRFFDMVKVPPEFLEQWNDRCAAFVTLRDRTFFFMCLLYNLGGAGLPPDQHEWPNAILTASNLPTVEILIAECREEAAAIRLPDNILIDEYAEGALDVGDPILEKYGLNYLDAVWDSDFVPPPILTGDSEWVTFSPGIGDFWKCAPPPNYQDVCDLHEQISEFVSACVR